MARGHRAAKLKWAVVSRWVGLLPALLPGQASSVGHLEPLQGGAADQAPIVLPLDGTSGLTLLGTRARPVTYRGRRAVEITEDPAAAGSGSLEDVALIDKPEFKDGTVDVWVASILGPRAAADDRGFIGLAFRSTPDRSRFENLYIRPTNGRADDQLRRNHSTQYASLPDYPWDRLRTDSPGKYESYVDLVPGEWTRIRIVVSGQRATLFVNNAQQPCLVVTDLKMGASHGKIGLWIGPGTQGYFSHMVVTPAG
jgi:hypothetical protein